jgi:hypothetical protein
VTSTPSSGPGTSSDPDAIREEIEQTRADLADTVDALQYKLDVKARTKDRARATGEQLHDRGVELKEQATARGAQLKEQATTDAGKPRPEVVAGVVALVALVVAVAWWRRR